MSEDYSTLFGVTPALTNERLTSSLTEWFGEGVTFTHWEYVSGTGKGDSYLSDLMRIKIHGKASKGDPKHVQVILKCIPKSLARRLTFRSDQFFKNEINFYEIILPALLKFQVTKNMNDPFRNYAKLFFSYSDGEHDVIVLEDAALQNFGSALRQEGIDLTHCKVSLKALAQYHALSFALKDQNPEEFERIQSVIFETYYSDNIRSWYIDFWKRLCGIAVDAVEKELPNSKYLDKIKQFAVPETYDRCLEACKDKTYGVISHGDCWTNNFLYRYVDKKPIDALIIDFQLSRCASPILDISFFIYACTTQDLRLEHHEFLLKYYYEVLSNQIRDMGSDPDRVYSWNMYMDEVKKYSFFGLAFSLESTPVIVLAPEDAMEVEVKGDQKVNINDVWQLTPFKTREGRLREVGNIVHAVDQGYI